MPISAVQQSDSVIHIETFFLAFPAFNMPSSLSLIISNFRFKVRDVRLFLSLEHLEANAGLLIGLISILLCLREQGGPRRGGEMEEQPVGGAVRTGTTFID